MAREGGMRRRNEQVRGRYHKDMRLARERLRDFDKNCVLASNDSSRRKRDHMHSKMAGEESGGGAKVNGSALYRDIPTITAA